MIKFKNRESKGESRSCKLSLSILHDSVQTIDKCARRMRLSAAYAMCSLDSKS